MYHAGNYVFVVAISLLFDHLLDIFFRNTFYNYLELCMGMDDVGQYQICRLDYRITMLCLQEFREH